MSQDIKMKPAKKPFKKVELNWIQSKLYNISLLFLVISVILTLIGATSIRYGVFDRETIVSNVRAESVRQVKAPVSEVEIKDCATAITVASKQYGAPEDLMQRIMLSESGNKHTVENSVSTATGCFQWILGSWRYYGKELWNEDFYEKNIYNPKDNAELAAYVISKYGTKDWDASRHAWGSR